MFPTGSKIPLLRDHHRENVSLWVGYHILNLSDGFAKNQNAGTEAQPGALLAIWKALQQAGFFEIIRQTGPLLVIAQKRPRLLRLGGQQHIEGDVITSLTVSDL